MDVSVTTVLVAAFALVAAIALILVIFIGCAITMNEVGQDRLSEVTSSQERVELSLSVPEGFFAETKEKKDERKEESNT